MSNRSATGNYWTADAPSGTNANAIFFYFFNAPSFTTITVPRATINSVRCIVPLLVAVSDSILDKANR